MTILARISAPIKRHPGPKPRPRPRPRPVNPRDAWPAWCEQERWTTTEESESSIDLTDFCRVAEPTARSEAYECGFQVGYALELDAVPSSDLPGHLSLSWWYGRNAGWLRRVGDDLRIDDHQADDRRERSTGIFDADVYPAGATS